MLTDKNTTTATPKRPPMSISERLNKVQGMILTMRMAFENQMSGWPDLYAIGQTADIAADMVSDIVEELDNLKMGEA